LIEATQEIQRLLANQKDNQQSLEDSQAVFRSSLAGMQQYKSQLNFRIKMAQSREQALISEKLQSKDQEVDLLKRILSDKNRELEELKTCVESNPLLAERHGKVLDLELQLK
jgi:predicted RNase H-like nuclease (RuvC/YqgF family)